MVADEIGEIAFAPIAIVIIVKSLLVVAHRRAAVPWQATHLAPVPLGNHRVFQAMIGLSRRFDTKPSSPIRHPARNRSGPPPVQMAGQSPVQPDSGETRERSAC